MNTIITRLLLLISTIYLSTFAHAINIQRWTTPEGTKVLLVERHENPIIDLNISFKGAGAAFNPINKAEVSNFTALMLTKGTKDLDEEAFNQKVNDLAVNIYSVSNTEGSRMSLRSLSKPTKLNVAIKLLNQSLTQPRFDENILERLKKQSTSALRQQLANPSFIASRELTLLNYPNHPYGISALTTEQSIAAVTIADIQAFHRNHFAKNNAVVSLVGDLSRRQADLLVKEIVKDLPERSNITTTLTNVPTHVAKQKFIPFSGTQAKILLGMPLITRKDHDYYAFVVGNYILGGGGFDSRLMKTLRNQHGYTYAVSSQFVPYGQAGPFLIGFSTKKSSAREALAASINVLNNFITEGPTETELQQAKDNIVGSFPLRFDSNDKLLGYLDLIGFYDLADDYLEAYPKAVSAMTVDQVKSAWQRRIDPQKMNIVVVGAQK